MTKRIPRTYLWLFMTILISMSLPKEYSERMRGTTIATFTPMWQTLSEAKQMLNAFIGSATSERALSNKEQQKIQIENQLLRTDIQHLKEFAEQVQQLQVKLPKQRAFQPVVAARVIFRAPSAWNSSIWIDVGKVDNAQFNSEVIAKNSPVLVGASIVGVIDYVGDHQCRVRLVTDSGLTPSVRVIRPIAGKTGKSEFQYLAKGELHGSSLPVWRSSGSVLHGTGFNYDFSDEYGSARDLRSGIPGAGLNHDEAIPLIQEGDLLVTTGLDGVFPAGLHVAKVTKIHLLKEGDYYYELEADPTAGNLDSLDLVFVIPPLGYDAEDQPPIIGR